MTRAERIMAMAIQQGPLGVRQYDFDYPARDKGPEIKAISTIIATAKLGLDLYHTAEGPVWYLPEFAPAEYFRTGWGCSHLCGGRHTQAYRDKVGTVCCNCGKDGLFQLRIVRQIPEPAETKAAA
jgi:hypothetical protein